MAADWLLVMATQCTQCGHQQLATNAPAAVRTKLLMLAAPFLKRWSYSRIAEQVGSASLAIARTDHAGDSMGLRVLAGTAVRMQLATAMVALCRASCPY